MTLPTLIQNHNKKVVETRLAKFYSIINQAVKMAEVEYGDKKVWWQDDLPGAQFDDDGNPIEGTSEVEKWFNKYLAPNLKIVKRETHTDGSFIVYLADGSALRSVNGNTRDWFFYPGNPKKCFEKYGDWSGYGICAFRFNYMPLDVDETNIIYWKYHANKGFEPWKYRWDGTEETLKKGCYQGGILGSETRGGYCAALIQYNGWRIPDDYPHKVSY